MRIISLYAASAKLVLLAVPGWVVVFLLLLLPSTCYGDRQSSSHTTTCPLSYVLPSAQSLSSSSSLTVSRYHRRVPLTVLCPRGGASTDVFSNGEVNPLVVSSPVVAAAVCQDGIVLLAAHNIKGKAVASSKEEEDNNDGDDRKFLVLHDLPDDFAGPFRIQSLDRGGTTSLLTAGWRADAEYFVTKAQEIVKSETETLGTASPLDASVLASQFSLFMATMALDGGSRELNCVALLASRSKKEGSLWLVDQTGAYPVRAIALGGGSSNMSMLLNGKLREQQDWKQLSSKQGLVRLVEIVSQCLNDSAQQQRAVEMAVIDFQGRRLVRKFLKDLY